MATTTQGIPDGEAAARTLRFLSSAGRDIPSLPTATGIDEATLRHELEDAPEQYTVETFLRIADALDVEPHELITEVAR